MDLAPPAKHALEGKVVVVTGASSGIGAATARALAATGVKVVVGARRGERLSRLCDDIRASGGTAEPVPTDMRDEMQVQRLIDVAAGRYGQLDAVVNNAATGTVRLIEEGRTEEWRQTLETNVLGVLVSCRAALRHMLPRGRGDLLNVTSASAHEAWPYLAVYAASKAAVYSLSRSLRAEVAGRGIRVMTLEIHNVGATEFASSFDADILPRAVERWARLGLLNPETPLLEPADVGRAVVFQLSQPDPVSIHDLTIRSRAN